MPGNDDLALIKLDKISRVFDSSPPVFALKETSLEINEGEFMAIVGPSGSGKSTLLSILGLLDKPSTGEYYLNNLPTVKASENERAYLRGSTIGFVFQSFHLISLRSVLDNVMLGTMYSGVEKSEREELAVNALKRVNLGHRIYHTPNNLSGGERQRVAIARAVASKPKLLLADEPTGNLDRENTVTVLDLFEELHSDGLSCVLITHEHEVAERAKREVKIVDGYLEETR